MAESPSGQSESTEITAGLAALGQTVRDMNRMPPQEPPSTFFLTRLRLHIEQMGGEQNAGLLPSDQRAVVRRIYANFVRGMESLEPQP